MLSSSLDDRTTRVVSAHISKRINFCTLSRVSQWERGSQDWSGNSGVYLKSFPSCTELWGRPAVSTRCFHTEIQPNDGENYPRWFWGWITERPKRPPVGTLRNIFEKHIVGTKITDIRFHRIVSLHLLSASLKPGDEEDGRIKNVHVSGAKSELSSIFALFLKFLSLFRALPDEKIQPGSARPPSGVTWSLVRSQGAVASNGGALHFVSRPQETGKQKLLLHAVLPNPQTSPVA